MKRLGKIFIFIFAVFIMNFSFVACANEREDTYVPPAGVDMTSMSEYVVWLLENMDTSHSYEATATLKEGSKIETRKILSETRTENGVTGRIVLEYKGGVLSNGFEIVNNGTDYSVINLDIGSKTYTETKKNRSQVNQDCANILCAYGVAMLPYTVELNNNFEIGTDVSTIPQYDGTSVTETVTNPSNGKYVLTRTLTVNNSTATYTITVLNNRIINYSLDSSYLSVEVNYEYKNVTISEDFSEYVEAN